MIQTYVLYFCWSISINMAYQELPWINKADDPKYILYFCFPIWINIAYQELPWINKADDPK